jgi:hypothetical protein
MLLFLGAGSLCAQVASERPLQEVFQTDLVYTQDPGEFQLTAGFGVKRNHGILLQWPLQAEYGLTDSWQVQFESDGWRHKTQPGQPTEIGVGDLSLGTKYSFMNIHGSPFHAALSLNIGVPSGSVNQELGEGFLSYEPSVILARDFRGHGNLQVFTQVGISFVQRTQHHRDRADDVPSAHRFQWSGGLFRPFRHVVVTSELSWQTNRWNHGGRDNELYLTSGTVWKLPGRWELGVGVSAGLTPLSDAVGLQVKFAREFQSRNTREINEREK